MVLGVCTTRLTAAVMLVLQPASTASVLLLLVANGKWRGLLFPQYDHFVNTALLVGLMVVFHDQREVLGEDAVSSSHLRSSGRR
jgi:hypothetical protein